MAVYRGVVYALGISRLKRTDISTLHAKRFSSICRGALYPGKPFKLFNI